MTCHKLDFFCVNFLKSLSYAIGNEKFAIIVKRIFPAKCPPLRKYGVFFSHHWPAFHSCLLSKNYFTLQMYPGSSLLFYQTFIIVSFLMLHRGRYVLRQKDIRTRTPKYLIPLPISAARAPETGVSVLRTTKRTAWQVPSPCSHCIPQKPETIPGNTGKKKHKNSDTRWPDATVSQNLMAIHKTKLEVKLRAVPVVQLHQYWRLVMLFYLRRLNLGSQ